MASFKRLTFRSPVCGWFYSFFSISFLLLFLSPKPAFSLPSPTSPISPSPLKSHSDIKTPHKLLIVIGTAAFLLLLLLLLMGYFIRFRVNVCGGKTTTKKRNAINGDQILPTTHEPDLQGQLGEPRFHKGLWRFSWGEIERVTRKFSCAVGEGGFSTVYLARFSDSTLGAVKINRNSERLNRAFKQELEILMHVRHENIVKLLGYCDEREEGILVFEFLSNGTLHDKLHNNGPRLPWPRRMSIAFQIARAIEHLHDNCDLQIVHCDVKPSNVLLDEKLNCKLCDLGSAKMGFSSTILPSSASPVMGSPGYADPHYLRTGIVSKKNDVYSFGVLVLEMVTGMEAFCEKEEKLLTNVLGPVLKDPRKVVEVVDCRLEGEFDSSEAIAMASISADCLQQQPSSRPSMAEILRRMEEKISAVGLAAGPSKEDCKPLM